MRARAAIIDAGMYVTANADRVITFFKGLAAGLVVIGILVMRLWQPGMGEVLSDTTKGDWVLLGAIFGTLLVLIALLFAIK